MNSYYRLLNFTDRRGYEDCNKNVISQQHATPFYLRILKVKTKMLTVKATSFLAV